MNVSQAIICGGGKGLRLGMGSKPFIIYKNKLLLEYCIISCLNANIKDIIITIVPKKYNLGREKTAMLVELIKKYPGIKFVYDDQKGFGEKPDYVRKYLDQTAPFYLLTGHSPQSSLFLKKLALLYRKQSIVFSGYKYGYKKRMSVCMVNQNKIGSCENFELIRPRVFKSSKKEQFIIGEPHILNYHFYDEYAKKDNYSHSIEYYVDKFVRDGNSAYCIENFGNIPEIDYKRDFSKALEIIDQLDKEEHYFI